MDGQERRSLDGADGRWVVLDGLGCASAQAEGKGRCGPAVVGIRPLPHCAACWRGSVCDYGVEGDALVLERLHIALRNWKDVGPAPGSDPIIDGLWPTDPRSLRPVSMRLTTTWDVGYP